MEGVSVHSEGAGGTTSEWTGEGVLSEWIQA